jgi:Na+-driven multidrug efflux pump
MLAKGDDLADRADALKPNDAFIDEVVARYLAPSVLSMIGMRVSALANGLILGNRLGETGLSALSIVTPISLVHFSAGALIGVGASVISGVALGRGDREGCNRIYSLSYTLSLLTSLLMMIVCLSAADEIAAALGAADAVFPLVRDYIRIAAVGGVFTVMLYTPLNFLRLCGKSNPAMGLLLIMSFASTGFSAFFVVARGMKTDGVALGSCLGAMAACLFGLYCLGGKRSELRICRPRFAARDLSAILGSGSAPALNNFCRAAQYVSVNLLFARVAPRALPAYSVVCTMQDMVLAIILGFSQILLPLVSVSYGERDGRCIRVVTKRILFFGSVAVGVCALFLLLFRGHVGGLFGIRDETVLSELRVALLFMAFSLNAALINNIAVCYFNAVRRAGIAGATSICRLFAFMVVPAYLLAGVMGARAVWISLVACELLCMAFLAAALTRIRARDKGLSRFWLLDASFAARKNVIDFSVSNTNEAAAFASARIVDFCETNAVPTDRTLCLSLSIEEMLLLINEHAAGKGRTAFTDVRVVALERELTLRIRNAGLPFNPIEAFGFSSASKDAARTGASPDGIATDAIGADADTDAMGMRMILTMAKKVEYKTVFGVNNLTVMI